MQLTDQQIQAADAYSHITAERKKTILDHITQTPDHRRKALLNQMLSTPGATAKFVLHVFGPQHDPGASPDNKSVTPPTTV